MDELAVSIIGALSPLLMKGVDTLFKEGFSDAYEYIKSLFQDNGKEIVIENYERDPEHNQKLIIDELSKLFESDSAIRSNLIERLPPSKKEVILHQKAKNIINIDVVKGVVKIN